jgi:XRE family transcriptional regulator, fatty acid utilization regulator
MTPHEIYLKKIGANIRKARTAKNIKQETLGRKVNLNKSEISRIENGKREAKLTMLRKIAFEINVTVSSLLDD